MSSTSILDSRQQELWRRLGEVNDPELDEPVTDMGFVERAFVAKDGRVEVDFRLPTYWCSPNFAFLMLDDIRERLAILSWSPVYRVQLRDHMFADEVNSGIDAGKSFGEIFNELAVDADLGSLREVFARKAFMRRQEAVILGLRRQGLTDGAILGMKLADYDEAYVVDDEVARQKPRYRDALLKRWPNWRSQNSAFITWEGVPIEAERLGTYLTELRSVRISMEFNGALCRGLKGSRYKELNIVDGEPTLVDFIADRVPPENSSNHVSRN